MKNLIKKLSNTNISKTYMFILLGVSALMMTGYFSYAWFTVQGVQKYSVVTGNLTGTATITDSTGNKTTVDITGNGIISYTPPYPTDGTEITIDITNTSDRTIKNSIYYNQAEPDDCLYLVGYTKDSATKPVVEGTPVEKGKTSTYKIKIVSSSSSKINFYVSLGLVNSNLKLPDNYMAIGDENMTASNTILSKTGSGLDNSDYYVMSGDTDNYIWYSGKLWRAVSVNQKEHTLKMITQWNISSISYSDGNSSAFQGSYMEQWLNDTSVDGFLGNLRDYKKFIKTDSEWNATALNCDPTNCDFSREIPETTMVTDAVGLLNTYEVVRVGFENNNEATTAENTLTWATLTPIYDDSSSIFEVYQNNNGFEQIAEHNTDGTIGIRPVVNLLSTVKIVAGTGTEDDPYRLEGDNDTDLTGTLLSNRYSGEYVKFGNEDNRLYRIVSHEGHNTNSDDILTKLTSAVPIKISGSYVTRTFDRGGSSTFLGNTTISNFLEENKRDYLNMDDTTEDYSQDLLDPYKMFIAPYTQGTSYRLIKYTDTTMNEESTNYVDSEIGLLRVGELMAGQFDTINNNTEYWLLNSTDSDVYNVETDGRLSAAAPANATYGIKPALFISPYAVITGGTGTKTDPFTIKSS
ncbi:unknown [Clostridium sp. CAG:451]|nr:unknown [Clostridium sp. CAG:451]